MTKKICFLLFVLFSLQGYAQTGIGTSTPHASAKLEVSSTNKGFLPPRVTLTAATDAVTIPSPAEGLLVYNLGSVGLQAGYYYWNGANWATIATGTTAGNAVVAGDLVKLYSEGYSNASGKLSNASGFSFSVPISGRYLFDFSSTTWGGNATTTFKVRQGTTDLGTDFQTSLNNNVHVEYNGKVEVNLQSGITYNVALTTNANRDAGDYDRVYYKMVAGNLPVNQHMADRNIQLNNNYLSNDGGNEGIRVDNSGNVGIGTTSPAAKLHLSNSGAAGLELSPTAGALGGTYIQAYNRSTSDFTPLDIYASQIAVWTNNAERMRITSGGNVGIGTSTPTEKLEVSGNVKATNFIGTASSATLYLLEAYANVSYTLPGSYTNDPCRYSIVNFTVNVPSSWFNTSTYRFTPQKAGYWEIIASYDVYRNNEANLSIQKNGTNLASAGAIYSVVQQVNKIIYLNGSTDYITIVNAGAGSNPRGQGLATSWFQARWVGE